MIPKSKLPDAGVNPMRIGFCPVGMFSSVFPRDSTNDQNLRLLRICPFRSWLSQWERIGPTLGPPRGVLPSALVNIHVGSIRTNSPNGNKTNPAFTAWCRQPDCTFSLVPSGNRLVTVCLVVTSRGVHFPLIFHLIRFGRSSHAVKK